MQLVFLIGKYSQGYTCSLCPMLTTGLALHMSADKFYTGECGSLQLMHVGGILMVR